MSEPVLQDQVRIVTPAQLQAARAMHTMYGFLVGVGLGATLTLLLFVLTGLRVC